MNNPRNETADFLLRQIRFLKRVGTPAQKQDAPRWERLIETIAVEGAPEAVAFATPQEVTP